MSRMSQSPIASYSNHSVSYVRILRSMYLVGLYSVQVFSGSPADGRLQRGDVFVSINNHDVSRMQQQQAQELVKAAGSALALVVKR